MSARVGGTRTVVFPSTRVVQTVVVRIQRIRCVCVCVCARLNHVTTLTTVPQDLSRTYTTDNRGTNDIIGNLFHTETLLFTMPTRGSVFI